MLVKSSPQQLQKLFLTGATVGPLLDGLHNQALLRYQLLPLDIFAATTTTTTTPLLATSWLVPPLLGLSYCILGGILPKLVQERWVPSSCAPPPRNHSKLRALLAVCSTAAILRLSYTLLNETAGGKEVEQYINLGLFDSASTTEQQLVFLLTLAIAQWALLDGSLSSLIVAAVTSIGGPLCELPFIGAGCWEYLDSGSDALYYPLQLVGAGFGTHLGLNAITGPCYFAVSMDAIALGRLFESLDDQAEMDHQKEVIEEVSVKVVDDLHLSNDDDEVTNTTLEQPQP